MDCDLSRSHNLSGPPFLVYKMKITTFGKCDNISDKAICPCILLLICSSHLFIASFICRLHTEDTIMNKRDSCEVHILVRNPDDMSVSSGSGLCVGGDTVLEGPVPANHEVILSMQA